MVTHSQKGPLEASILDSARFLHAALLKAGHELPSTITFYMAHDKLEILRESTYSDPDQLNEFERYERHFDFLQGMDTEKH